MKKEVGERVEEAARWDEAFSALYNTYVLALYGYGHKFTPDADLVEDCHQDLSVLVAVRSFSLPTPTNLALIT
jgi:hypothetical protein